MRSLFYLAWGDPCGAGADRIQHFLHFSAEHHFGH